MAGGEETKEGGFCKSLIIKDRVSDYFFVVALWVCGSGASVSPRADLYHGFHREPAREDARPHGH